MRAACWRCRFFEQGDWDETEEERAGFADGFCHRFPPVPDGDYALLPGVGALSWCGEFEEAPDA